MDFINSTAMWIVCGVMVFAVLIQSVWIFRIAWREAERLNLDKSILKSSIRSASMTAVGPTFSTVIALVSLIIFVGGPVGWMRVCDIGAPRTELAVMSIAETLAPANATELLKFSYANWAMAFNNVGWMIVTLLLTPRMEKMVEKMNVKFDVRLVKLVMAGAAFGLFACLWLNTVVGKQAAHWTASAASIITMVILNKFCAKKQTLIELSFGISMIVGMVAATLVHYALK